MVLTVRTVQISLYGGIADARGEFDRGPQGARGRHPVPPVPLPATLRTARPDPGARRSSLAAPEHPAASPAPARGGRPRDERDPPGPERRATPDRLHGGRARRARGTRLPPARRHPDRT